jgi:hypothetical protein
LDRLKNADSIFPPFGTEDDKNGDMPDRWFPFFATGIVNDSDELVASATAGLSLLVRWTELLLRRCCTSPSSLRARPKNEPLEAVIGVVGVFAISLVGGGERFLSERPCSCNAAIFAAVGVLSGPSVIGGSRNGCKFFLPCGACFFSLSNLDV